AHVHGAAGILEAPSVGAHDLAVAAAGHVGILRRATCHLKVHPSAVARRHRDRQRSRESRGVEILPARAGAGGPTSGARPHHRVLLVVASRSARPDENYAGSPARASLLGLLLRPMLDGLRRAPSPPAAPSSSDSVPRSRPCASWSSHPSFSFLSLSHHLVSPRCDSIPAPLPAARRATARSPWTTRS